MTIVLGSGLGVLSLYFLNRQHQDPRQGVALAAELPSLFWGAKGAAFAVPGTGGLQVDFPQLVPRVRGIWVDERFVSGLLLALTAIGHAAARPVSRPAP